MDNFTYWNPTKLIFGKGEVKSWQRGETIRPQMSCLYTAEAALNETVYTIKSFNPLKRQAQPSVNCLASNRIRVLPL